MDIFLNGEPRQVATDQTLASLIEQLGYTGKRIATERNGEIVPKSQYTDTLLAAGDRLEIVVAVGGG
ncbi:MAG: sulfur carrier protein ThiS [Lautropia sp.]|nr:sulfur carrier protein ThiS [Lautropia sp.]